MKNNLLTYFDNIIYDLVIFYKDGILSGILYEKKENNIINILCQKQDITFWFKDYFNILENLKKENVMHILFSPFLKKYKSLVVEQNLNIVINEVDGFNFQNCLEKLNRNFCIKKSKEINKIRNLKYSKYVRMENK